MRSKYIALYTRAKNNRTTRDGHHMQPAASQAFRTASSSSVPTIGDIALQLLEGADEIDAMLSSAGLSAGEMREALPWHASPGSENTKVAACA